MLSTRETHVVSVQKPGAVRPIQGQLAGSAVPAGFPSPAEDHIEQLDISSLLLRNPESTFFLRVAGESMTGAGIDDGDLLIVDRSLQPHSGDIVIAVIDGEFTVKRFRYNGTKCELLPENPKFRKITISEETELEIWGVVTNTIKAFR